jgi:hypothetical protein
VKFNEDWLRERGFVPDGKGGWAKPSRDVHPVRPAPAAVPEHRPEPAPLREAQGEAIYPGRVRVRITSFCCGTLRDTDNIFVKYALDCCRYARIISEDSPDKIELQVREVRVKTRKEEGFLVEVIPL